MSSETGVSSIPSIQGWPEADRRRVEFVLTDIDDTLTLHGRLPAVAYAAMERLASAGFKVIPITGRPAGWCDHIARMWPVDGVEQAYQRLALRATRGEAAMADPAQDATVLVLRECLHHGGFQGLVAAS